MSNPTEQHQAFIAGMQRDTDAGKQLADDAKVLGLKLQEADAEPDGVEMPLVNCKVQMVQCVMCDPCPQCGFMHASVVPEVIQKAAVGAEPILIDCNCGMRFAAIRKRIISKPSGIIRS